MIGERAAADAIERARRNPELRVGLHVALCEARPVSNKHSIPDLLDPSGELLDPLRAFANFLRPGVRAQIEREIRAQFQAFRATGLVLDHVNAHNNMQLHPVVLPILLRVAREYGATALRLPYEPLVSSWRAARRGFLLRLLGSLGQLPWVLYVKQRAQRAGFDVNDYFFGMYDCGALDEALFVRFVQNLPDGVSEIHCHPATRRCPEIDRTMPRYRHEAELAALTSQRLRDALAASGVHSLAGFGELRLPDLTRA
jgi:hopanoid biosynthesis associated protein HpnK